MSFSIGKVSRSSFSKYPLTEPLFTGELRHINKLRYWPLEAVLHDKYLFPKQDADALGSFLLPMLRLQPDKRAKASDLMHHNWLDGIVVQGEIDVIRRAEADENARRAKLGLDSKGSGAKVAQSPRSPGLITTVAGGEGSREDKRLDALVQSERDAMKPVEDSVLNGDDEGDDEEDEHDQPQQQKGGQYVHGAPILNAPPVPAHHGNSTGGSGIAQALRQNANAGTQGKGQQQAQVQQAQRQGVPATTRGQGNGGGSGGSKRRT